MLALEESEERNISEDKEASLERCQEQRSKDWRDSKNSQVKDSGKSSIVIKTSGVSTDYPISENSVSFIASALNGEEFLIITDLESVNSEELIKDKALKLSQGISSDEEEGRFNNGRNDDPEKLESDRASLIQEGSYTMEDILLVEKESKEIMNVAEQVRHEKMEEQDFNRLLPSDAVLIQKSNKDPKESSNWLKSFRPLPLYYTDRGKPYLKCPACGAMFFTSTSFQKHLFSHMYRVEDSYICSFCNYANTEAGMLFAHLSKHQDQCEFCNENLMRKNNFEKHFDACASSLTLKRDRRGRFVCAACKLVFDLLPQLEKHWFKHSCKKLRTYQCKECWGLYESQETLLRHKCLKCPICCEIYDSLHRLKAHTMWTKHYLKCPICSYEFILTMDHEKHLALHRQHYRPIKDHQHCLQSADGKTFQCNLCDKIFYAVPRLILHLQEEHGVETLTQGDDERKGKDRDDINETLLNELKKGRARDYPGDPGDPGLIDRSDNDDFHSAL